MYWETCLHPSHWQVGIMWGSSGGWAPDGSGGFLISEWVPEMYWDTCHHPSHCLTDRLVSIVGGSNGRVPGAWLLMGGRFLLSEWTLGMNWKTCLHPSHWQVGITSGGLKWERGWGWAPDGRGMSCVRMSFLDVLRDLSSPLSLTSWYHGRRGTPNMRGITCIRLSSLRCTQRLVITPVNDRLVSLVGASSGKGAGAGLLMGGRFLVSEWTPGMNWKTCHHPSHWQVGITSGGLKWERGWGWASDGRGISCIGMISWDVLRDLSSPLSQTGWYHWGCLSGGWFSDGRGFFYIKMSSWNVLRDLSSHHSLTGWYD